MFVMKSLPKYEHQVEESSESVDDTPNEFSSKQKRLVYCPLTKQTSDGQEEPQLCNMVEAILSSRKFISKYQHKNENESHYYKDFEKCQDMEKSMFEIQCVVDTDIMEKAMEVQAIRDRYEQKASEVLHSS
jgi:thiamine monophosphate synthase